MNTLPEPLVSVVVPTYRRPDLLVETLRSLLRQTLREIEVLVCDDGADDATAGVVHALGDARLIYRRNPTNLRQALNVREGFRAARGRYVSLLHDDDLLEPEALATLAGGLEAHPGATLAFCDHWIIDGQGRRLLDQTDQTTARYGRGALPQGLHQPFVRIALQDRSIHFALGTTYRKAALDLDDYPAEVGEYCDRWLGYLACRGGGGAYYVAERLSSYRQHGVQVSHQRGMYWARSAAFCAATLLEDPRLREIQQDLVATHRFAQYALGVESLWAGESTAARRHLLRGFTARPLHSTAGLALSVLPKPALAAMAPLLR